LGGKRWEKSQIPQGEPGRKTEEKIHQSLFFYNQQDIFDFLHMVFFPF